MGKVFGPGLIREKDGDVVIGETGLLELIHNAPSLLFAAAEAKDGLLAAFAATGFLSRRLGASALGRSGHARRAAGAFDFHFFFAHLRGNILPFGLRFLAHAHLFAHATLLLNDSFLTAQ